jgi:hypothetical protein
MVSCSTWGDLLPDGLSNCQVRRSLLLFHLPTALDYWSDVQKNLRKFRLEKVYPKAKKVVLWYPTT